MLEDTILKAIVNAAALAIGPAGVAFALVAIVVSYFYRRDVQINGVHAKRELDRLLSTLSAQAVSNDRLALAVKDLTVELRRHEEREFEVLNGLGTRLEHAISAGLHTAVIRMHTSQKE